MKKHNLIIFFAGVACISLTAFAFINMTAETATPCEPIEATTIIEQADLDPITPRGFIYGFHARFGTTFDLDALASATVVTDLVEIQYVEEIRAYSNIQISTFNEDGTERIVAKSENEVLTQEQKKLLNSMDYTSSFFIVGDLMRAYDRMTILKDTLVTYLSVAPTYQATYLAGEETLIRHLKVQSLDEVAKVDMAKLQQGMIRFRVTTEGTIASVNLSASSGFESLDQKFMEILLDLPSNWKAAVNFKGEKVEQELIYFFGQMGC